MMSRVLALVAVPAMVAAAADINCQTALATADVSCGQFCRAKANPNLITCSKVTPDRTPDRDADLLAGAPLCSLHTCCDCQCQTWTDACKADGWVASPATAATTCLPPTGAPDRDAQSLATPELCTQALCCVQKCSSSVTCNLQDLKVNKADYATRTCTLKTTCSVAQCCDQATETCATEVTCEAGYCKAKTNSAKHYCTNLVLGPKNDNTFGTCTAATCCDCNCDTYTGKCATSSWTPRPAPATIACPGGSAVCNDNKCCFGTCAAVNCHWYNKHQDKAGKTGVRCNGACSTNDCCDAAPTCAGFTCPGAKACTRKAAAGNRVCSGVAGGAGPPGVTNVVTCSVASCCDCNCGVGNICPATRTKITVPAPAARDCGTGCTVDMCCNGICHAGLSCTGASTAAAGAAAVRCTLKECTTTDCCHGTCSTTSCPANLIKQDKAGKNAVRCNLAGPGHSRFRACGDTDCCENADTCDNQVAFKACAAGCTAKANLHTIVLLPADGRHGNINVPAGGRAARSKDSCCTCTCGTFSGAGQCGATMEGKNAAHACPGATCNVATCCQGRCNLIPGGCGADLVLKLTHASVTCSGVACPTGICCVGKCAANVGATCAPTPGHNRGVFGGLECLGRKCTKSDCCEGRCAADQCKATDGKKNSPNHGTPCTGATCTDAHCCVDLTCADHTCPTTFCTHIPSPTGTKCNRGGGVPANECSHDKCCECSCHSWEMRSGAHNVCPTAEWVRKPSLTTTDIPCTKTGLPAAAKQCVSGTCCDGKCPEGAGHLCKGYLGLTDKFADINSQRTIRCVGRLCAMTDCCIPNDVKCAGSICPDHTVKRAAALEESCVLFRPLGVSETYVVPPGDVPTSKFERCTLEKCCDGVCGSNWKTDTTSTSVPDFECRPQDGLKDKHNKVSKVCAGRHCTSDDCCDARMCQDWDRGQCSQQCKPVADQATKQCRQPGVSTKVSLPYCDTEVCCECNCETFSATHGCTSNYLAKKDLKAIACRATDGTYNPSTAMPPPTPPPACAHDLCCDFTCQHGEFQCGAKRTKKVGAAAIRCTKTAPVAMDGHPLCNHETCCRAVCDTIKCDPVDGLMDHFNKTSVDCGADVCTVDKCCQPRTCAGANLCTAPQIVVTNATACGKKCTTAKCCQAPAPTTDIPCTQDGECRSLNDEAARCVRGVCQCTSPGFVHMPRVAGIQFELCLPASADPLQTPVRFNFRLYYPQGVFDSLTAEQRTALEEAIRTYLGDSASTIRFERGSVVVVGAGQRTVPFPTAAGLKAAVAGAAPADVFGAAVDVSVTAATRACDSSEVGATETVNVVLSSGLTRCAVIACNETAFTYRVGADNRGHCIADTAVSPAGDDDMTVTIAVAVIGGVLAVVVLALLAMVLCKKSAPPAETNENEPAHENKDEDLA